MALDDPADKNDARVPRVRDHERPVDLPDAVRSVSVDSTESRHGEIERFDAADEQARRIRNAMDPSDDRAGAGGSPDQGPGGPGGTMGTGGTKRDWDGR